MSSFHAVFLEDLPYWNFHHWFVSDLSQVSKIYIFFFGTFTISVGMLAIVPVMVILTEILFQENWGKLLEHFTTSTINNAKNRRYKTSPLLFIIILHYHNHKPKIYLVKGCSICHALIFFISCNVILSYRTSSAFSNLVLLLSLLAKTPHHRICIVVHISRLVPPAISMQYTSMWYKYWYWIINN